MPAASRISDFQALKGQRKIVCLTAYTAPIASAIDPYCDLMLVGDSVGMVVYGMDDTRGVSSEMMCAHGKAVMRRRSHALVVIDLPFGSYENSPEQALETARHILTETEADAVKLEGGAEMAQTITILRAHDIEVMGHVGLLPQTAEQMRVTGRTETAAQALKNDIRALEGAGVFSIVIEAVIEPVATELASACAVPTIGIGASAACDGQILVTDDMLGLYDRPSPKFVRQFASVTDRIDSAARAYRSAVISGEFPAPDELYQDR